jgi:hypothetical protein
MRRPSRQGLIPVYISGDREMSAPADFKSPDQNPCLPDNLPLGKKHNNYRNIFYLLKAPHAIASIIIVFSLVCDADAQILKDKAKHFFDAVRLGNYPTIPTLFSQNEEHAFEILQPYLVDSVEQVALKAYQIVLHVSSRSRVPAVRAEGITILVAACNNVRPSIRSTAMEMLRQFRRDEFPSAAKDSLRKCIQEQSTPLEDVMKMAGFLHLPDLIPQIRPWSQPGNLATRRWAALLSLARMGDSFAITDIMQRVKKLPVNDDLVYRIFPDLVYTRRPEAIAYMVEVLTDDQYECVSADLEHERPIPCGFRVMEQLAPIIAHFPVQIDEGGDLETDDYPGALQQSRKWFMLNKTYTILTDRY